jgi:hypothetical protein
MRMSIYKPWGVGEHAYDLVDVTLFRRFYLTVPRYQPSPIVSAHKLLRFSCPRQLFHLLVGET